MLRADLHVHTLYSGDSTSKLADIVEHSLNSSINCLNICDHNTVEGALALKEVAPFKIIVSEEIESTEGEIMGLFLKETIPPGMSPEDTIRAIREQEGLVCIPHPFEVFRSTAMKAHTIERIKHLIDMVEVKNAKTLPFQDVNKPLRFARENQLRMTAGSDAHTVREIGNFYMEMPDFSSAEEFLSSLDAATIGGSGTSFATHCYSLFHRMRRKMGSG
ncbi:MAG: PHP-associated domain-containing protein [Dehalococcoidales bacterium]|nr:PHP-associated domain-containing protein [Dehalococcoidales bacterium]